MGTPTLLILLLYLYSTSSYDVIISSKIYMSNTIMVLTPPATCEKSGFLIRIFGLWFVINVIFGKRFHLLEKNITITITISH